MRGAEKNIWKKKMTENFPNLRKMLLYIAKKLNEFQVGDMQRDPYTNYSKNADRQKQKRKRKTTHHGLWNLNKNNR